ncbi:MAG: hypothetical protein Q7T24_08470 [Deltaproteobacteria bacterium]|nr:hypothetical protein [Deltaproteobacteria bacterium]
MSMKIKIIASGAAILTALVIGGAFSKTLVHAAAPPAGEAALKKDAPAQNDKDRGLIESVGRRQKDLDSREEELKIKEERIAAIRGDVEARIAELKRLHSSIEAFVKKIDEVNDERVKRLVKIYEYMSPEEAAARIEKLDQGTAVMILASVSEKKAAKILGFVDVEKSVKLSKALRIKED